MATAIRGQVGSLKNPRSLGGRLVMILTAVGITGAIAIAVLLAVVISPSFSKLELKGVDAHVDRTRAALVEYASKVESAVKDYGDWNDSYDYMVAPNAEFERESFSPLAMTNLDVNGMAYVGDDHRIVIARWIDERHAERADMRNRFVRAIAALNLAHVVGNKSSTAFYARLGNEVAAVGVARVRRSDGTGTPRGFVLMAREITSPQLAELLQLDARIDLAIYPQEVVKQTRGHTSIAVPITGTDGRAVASASFTVKRDVSLLGQRMLLLAIAGSVLLLLIVLMVLRRMIGRLVLVPLARVERHMERVRASGSMTLFEDDGRRDEIGSLGLSFNAMLTQLKDLREQIEVQSFALGRSESAVAVMHNVRNALSPISTVLSHGIAKAPPIETALLTRAVAELDNAPDERRRKIIAFLVAAVEAGEKARAEQVAELGIGRDALVHVLDIIGQQQAAAHERPQLSECDVIDIVAQNATIARYSGRTQIAFSYPAGPASVLANRVVLSQVIGNMFANAAEAIGASGRAHGAIAVSLDQDEGVVIVRIKDDGEGFDPEVGATLFQRGFSTRAHKSGGLGLHWCANSMTAMEGTLRLESEGKGRGATAVLTLKAPVAAAALAQAA